MNTCAKIIALAIDVPLSQVAETTVSHRGRGMLDNIYEVEARVIHYAAYYGGSPGTLLLDVAAALPSLAHLWIFQVLEKMGIPNFLVRVLRGLYRDLKATITIGSSNDLTLDIQADIKQGCPLRGAFFALTLDPFLRWLICQVSATPAQV